MERRSFKNGPATKGVEIWLANVKIPN